MFAASELFSVHGRTALVTGGATGLGRICAEALLGAGARVLIASRKGGGLRGGGAGAFRSGRMRGVRRHGRQRSRRRRAGRGDPEARRRVAHSRQQRGPNWGEPFEAYPWKAWERVMSVSVAGLFSQTRDLAPMLFASANAKRPPTVVNLGSVMGTATQAESSYAYSAAKAAVHYLTRILAQEFAGRQVTVNAVAAGPFPTNVTRFAIGDEAGAAKGAKAAPMGRVGREDDTAGAILFLAGRGGAYTTGAILPIDGGLSVTPPPSMFGGRE
jgi:NAD(P)-dependent dehydrogenase (short-subunit alcohol dehydrogenase family)